MAVTANHAKESDMANQQKDDSVSRSDTTAPGGAQPVQGQSGKIGSEIAGKGGGTDAAAGAQMAGAGNRGGSGVPRQGPEGGAQGGQGEQLSPGAGAAVAGGTGLGEAASAGDTRTGTSSGQAGPVTGGNPSSGDIPPPTDKGGGSAA
jgi:hypothetical protein